MEGGAGAVFDTGLSCLVTLAVGPKIQQILGVLAIISPGWAYAQALFISKSVYARIARR